MLRKLLLVAMACLLLGGPEMRATAQSTAEGDYAYEINSAGYAVITDYTGNATTLEIPNSLGGYEVKAIGDWAFAYCSNLTSVTLPDGITKIGSNAFNNCERLTGITIPEGVTEIGNFAFHFCSSLTAIDISKGITRINDYAFNKCSSLTNITIPEGVTQIGMFAFHECSNLTNVSLPEGVTEIGNNAFENCFALTNISIPKGVTRIGDYAFQFCTGLTGVSVPEELTEIGSFAFRNCSSLKGIKIPNGVNRIGLFAFSGCTSMYGIYGQPGSYIENYAKEYEYKFISLGNKSDAFATYQACFFVRDEGGNTRCYNEDGTPIINEFKCDGTYTYYFQADGTAMRDRLTYHPDGEHVIYFDEYGHEIFSDFANVKKTIAGEKVDDYCFFDVNGYLYVDVVTYDKTGTYLYYANPYGVMDKGKWFEFSDSVKWANGTPFDKAGGKYGYANEDGTLMTNQWTYDWEGRKCYMQGNGVAVY